MDELEISGKRFLSTRRAAKEHKYTSDYVGQLIRGGKVVGKKVGRSWYVSEESLNAYLSGEAAEPMKAQVLKVKEVVSEPVVEKAKEVELRPIAAPVAAVTYAEEKIAEPVVAERFVEEQTFEPVIVKAQPLEAHHIPIRMQSHVEERSSGGLRYVTDDEPSLPEVKRKVALSTAPAMRVHQAPVAPQQYEEAVEEYVEVTPRRKFGVFAIAGVLLVAAATFSATAAISATLNSRIVVEQGQVAGVGYTFR